MLKQFNEILHNRIYWWHILLHLISRQGIAASPRQKLGIYLSLRHSQQIFLKLTEAVWTLTSLESHLFWFLVVFVIFSVPCRCSLMAKPPASTRKMWVRFSLSALADALENGYFSWFENFFTFRNSAVRVRLTRFRLSRSLFLIKSMQYIRLLRQIVNL